MTWGRPSRGGPRRSRAPLTCQELVEIVTDYLEDRLSAANRRRFEEHLATCEGCAVYLDQMRRALVVLGRLGEASVPAGARDSLLSAFRDWKVA